MQHTLLHTPGGGQAGAGYRQHVAHNEFRVGSGPVTAGLLDAARGPLHPLAAETLVAALEVAWADPSRRHPDGRRARAHLDTGRAVLADAMGVRPDELSVHASAEEALTVGLAGLRHARRRAGERVVASAVERSVLLLSPGVADPVPVDRLGAVDLVEWSEAVTAPGVAAAVLQSANGEVGTRQPLAAAADSAHAGGVPLLVDATASLGRDDLPTGAADVLVADAATFGGPPLGLLAVRTGTRWSLPGPSLEAEQGRAAAAPWVPVVLAAAEAWRRSDAEREVEEASARELTDRIRAAAAAVPDVVVAGDPDDRLPHVVTFSVLFADGEVLLDELARHGIGVSSGSACTTSTLRPSHVLAAMGVLTQGNVRVTLPLAAVSPTRAADVDRLCAVLPVAVAAVRERLGTADL
jgi:cysteine desulfurase